MHCQTQLETGSAESLDQIDPAAMRIGERLCDGQSHARATIVTLAGKKWLEQSRAVSLGNTATIVHKGHDNPVIVLPNMDQ